MGDPELVARAQRAAVRLEQSWERWRRLHGLVGEKAQPVSSYVGYSLTEPWGRPRVIFGLAADEAEYLSALLERDESGDPRYSQGLLWEPEPWDRPAQPPSAPLPHDHVSSPPLQSGEPAHGLLTPHGAQPFNGARPAHDPLSADDLPRFGPGPGPRSSQPSGSTQPSYNPLPSDSSQPSYDPLPPGRTQPVHSPPSNGGQPSDGSQPAGDVWPSHDALPPDSVPPTPGGQPADGPPSVRGGTLVDGAQSARPSDGAQSLQGGQSADGVQPPHGEQTAGGVRQPDIPAQGERART